MLKRAVRALTAAVVIAVSAAGSASASGFDTNHGKPADQGSCVASVTNGGAQAGFIQDVQSGGPGAVGQLGREFGTSGGAGHVPPDNCF